MAKSAKNAKGLVKGSFWSGLVMCLNSNLINFFQAHRPQRMLKVCQSPNSCQLCGSAGTLKRKALDCTSFHQATSAGILISLSEFLGHIGQNKNKKINILNFGQNCQKYKGVSQGFFLGWSGDVLEFQLDQLLPSP